MPRTIDRDARKEQLAEAVWRVILDEGISAVSVRTVAERAGVVVGSLRHVFPTRTDLILFSAELMVRRTTERIRALPRTDNPREYALAVLGALMPLESDSRAEYEINIALIAESRAVPELRPARDDAQCRISDLALRVVRMLAPSAGDEEAVKASRRIHALVDGLAFNLFHRPLDSDNEWALDILRDEIDAIADR